uniref:Uncharacterized protein n=1 Tax=Anguilla anguilla TaxID=7936 RepID=A0A0E9UAQ4_ANGAN
MEYNTIMKIKFPNINLVYRCHEIYQHIFLSQPVTSPTINVWIISLELKY